MRKSKLIRNLKPGDKFTVMDDTGDRLRTCTVTVSSVRETRRAWFSGKRQWEVSADYPWWWPFPVRGYSTDRINLVK